MGFQDYGNQVQNQMQAAGASDQARMQQQGMLQSLLGQQNANQQYGIGNAGNMMNMGQADLNNAMVPSNVYGQLLQSIGGPTVLNDSWSTSTSKEGGVF
jgi:hypothetical protein